MGLFDANNKPNENTIKKRFHIDFLELKGAFKAIQSLLTNELHINCVPERVQHYIGSYMNHIRGAHPL